MAPRAELHWGSDFKGLVCQTAAKGAIEAKGISGAVSNPAFMQRTPRNTPGHREIARRYAWHAYMNGKSLPRPKKGQIGASKLITLIRLRELERLFSARYGSVLPDNATGHHAILLMAHHIVHAGVNAERHIIAWIAMWAPWMPASEAAAIAGCR
jgi:hypothetical protein